MRFEFATAGRIVFGQGSIAELGPAAKALGSRALVVTGLAAGETPVPSTLECALFSVRGEPTTDLAREGVGTLRREGCDLVVGIGGGSAIDAGKAIAALAANSGEPRDYLESLGAAGHWNTPRCPASPCRPRPAREPKSHATPSSRRRSIG